VGHLSVPSGRTLSLLVLAWRLLAPAALAAPPEGPPVPSSAGGHWAFRPVRRIEPPEDPTGWSGHPIDRFIMARLRREGLKPVEPAPRRVLLRRVTFDLSGLPPSPEEMAAFLADESPRAFERVVDRLLASPRYGERWGRHWMDLVRYSDTAGDNADYPLPEIRLYRDYLIDSLNSDKPYDEFLEEQIAGDLLAREGPPEKYAERVAATGFIALSRRFGTMPKELWHLTIEDSIETLGRTVLGLTLRCARCHDHKFDPITSADYYALYGIFQSTRYPYAGSEELQSKGLNRAGFVPLLPPERAQPILEAHRKKIEGLKAELQAAGKDQPRVDRLKSKLKGLERPGSPPDLPVAYAVEEGEPADAAIQLRGEPELKGPVVKRGVPSFLSGPEGLQIPPGRSGRLELARWLTRPENPLTSRVMANRIWQHHFGKGIVATPSNFGLRGDEPTHPELLDWLAARFIESGWSLKAMHRLVLLSRTYQLSSSFDETAAARDPGNRLLWRQDRTRLDAESIRDAMLASSRNLDLTRPGPHPFPPISTWSWTQHNPFKDVYPSNHRSVYLMTQRIQKHPYLALFDGPDANTSTDLRTSATVPLQALYLMNDPFVEEQARGLARRLLSASAEAGGRIALGFEIAWARPAGPTELNGLLHWLERCREEFERAGASGEELELEVWTGFARVLLKANEFVYLD
jgi:hypothetical protein